MDLHAQAIKELVAYVAVLIVLKLVVTRIVGMVRLFTDPLRNLLFRLLGRTPPRRNVDMVARMLRSKFAKDVDFPLTRVGINAGGLLIGAIETTSQAVAQVVEFFIDRPNLMATAKDAARQRSEEHTSELPSLMRISYAVFCLKKKTQNKAKYTNN